MGVMYGMELCAGIGALGLGVSRAIPGYRTVVAAEIEAFAVAVLAARQQDGSLPEFPIWDDLATFDGRPWRGRVSIVVAGYPCQPFSLAGKRLGADDPRNLWPHVARILDEVRAPLVFLENVAAHLGLGFRGVGEDLQRLGYRFTPGVVRASDVGAPHKRERLFVLAWDREQVADDHRGRLGERSNSAERQPPRRGAARESQSGRVELADAEQHELLGGRAVADAGNGESRPGAGSEPVRGRSDVADAERGGVQRFGEPGDLAGACGDAEGAGDQRQRGGRAARDPGAGVADATDGRRRARLEDVDARRGQPDDARSSAGLGWPGFPPGPADRDGWREYLRRYPDLAPATSAEQPVRGRLDGAASDLGVCLCSEYRVDQLRSLGNSVVPQQAEAALRLLWFRSFGEVLP